MKEAILSMSWTRLVTNHLVLVTYHQLHQHCCLVVVQLHKTSPSSMAKRTQPGAVWCGNYLTWEVITHVLQTLCQISFHTLLLLHLRL